MDFPAKLETPAESPPDLAGALGCDLRYVGRNQFDYLEVADETTLRGLDPAHQVLRKLPVRGIIATARGTGDFDFVSRFFAPGAGVDEDPVKVRVQGDRVILCGQAVTVLRGELLASHRPLRENEPYD